MSNIHCPTVAGSLILICACFFVRSRRLGVTTLLALKRQAERKTHGPERNANYSVSMPTSAALCLINPECWSAPSCLDHCPPGLWDLCTSAIQYLVATIIHQTIAQPPIQNVQFSATKQRAHYYTLLLSGLF
jgi:hypothetical protein